MIYLGRYLACFTVWRYGLRDSSCEL